MILNVTPKNIALLSSLGISIFTVFVLIFFNYCGFCNIKPIPILFFFIITFVIGFFILLNALEHFIYKKIKLIYKRISEKKFTDDEFKKNINLNEDLIEQVDESVKKWAFENQKEVAGLKKSEEYRKEFIGNVSHELKTPIFTIQGYIETLLDGAYKDEQLFIKFLRKASKNSSRLIEILDDLHIITELESDRLVVNLKSFNVYNLTKEIFEDLNNLANKFNISLKLKKNVENNFNVFADEEKIRRVLVNLLTNSIKYGKENGFTKVEFFYMEDKILIEISDNGIGISDEDKKRLFERFFRVERSRNRDRGGTGLGLSIVKHILEAHNQKINVRSNLGEGSTFAFTLQKS